MLASLFAQAEPTVTSVTVVTTDTSVGIFSGVWLFVWLVVAIVAIVAMWKIFVKAGRPGWASIVPIYNTYTLIEIAGKPGWWILLMLIPFVNVVVWLLVSIELAKAFGKSTVFGVVGLFIFSFIGMLMLGFGDAKYHGSDSSGSTPAPATPAAQ